MPMCLPPSQLKVIKDNNSCTLGYTCSVSGGKVQGCTEMACSVKRKPKCLKFRGVVNNTIPKNCTSWFDGCNNCSVSNGNIQACTKKACFVMEESRCLKYSNQ